MVLITCWISMKYPHMNICNTKYSDRLQSVIYTILCAYLQITDVEPMSYGIHDSDGPMHQMDSQDCLSDSSIESHKEAITSPLETSPRRQMLREQARVNLGKARWRMKVQYNKKVKVVQFSVGDKVSIRINKVDRSVTDVKRLPGVVHELKTLKEREVYRILTEHGLLKTFLPANELMPFSGIVKTNPEKKMISVTTLATKACFLESKN